ncbi:MAG TPA: glycosyltransferase family 4 protein [Candidatus Binatia bacterium]|jgi:glycosyltransferase involved in cell wall biosynthesis
MKILQTNFHLEWNGQVARVFLLSRELVQRGHSVVIAAPAASALAERASAEGIPVFTAVRFRKTNRPISLLRDVLALGRLIRRESFDCLHAHGSQDTWALVLARRLFRLKPPILLTRHNTKRVRFHFGNRWLYRRGIQRVVVVSRAALENYRRFLNAGILTERDLPIIHSCIDVERFAKQPQPEKIRAELGVGKAAPLIGLVGRVSPDKGHWVLLDAIPQVLQEFPDALFVFAGSVEGMGPAIRESIRSKGLENAVRVLGFREDVLDITAALDVSVLPSLGTDSSPAVLKEALYLGKPVIASRLAGLPEIVGDGRGALISPGDSAELARAVVTLLRDRQHGSTVSRDKFPERFTPGFMCSAYLEVYENLATPSIGS